jgi:acylphosphatase
VARCLHLFVSGRVQGVWFRESMRQEALAHGATGWVRNLADGRVEAVVCGKESTLQDMLAWARKGPPLASVTQVTSEEIPAQPFAGFEKRK